MNHIDRYLNKFDISDIFKRKISKYIMSMGDVPLSGLSIHGESLDDAIPLMCSFLQNHPNHIEDNIPTLHMSSLKWMEGVRELLGDVEGELETIKIYDNGFRWVYLLDETALNREWKLMDYYVGDWGYIDDLKSNEIKIISLRDDKNNPYCTIEYNVNDDIITQIKGKYNSGPSNKYIKYVEDLLKNTVIQYRSIDSDALANIGVVSSFGLWYDLDNLPDNLHVEGNLNLTDIQISMLPKGLRVDGDLFLINTNIDSLPDDIILNGGLYLSGSKFTELPNGLHIKGILDLRMTRIKSLPKGLQIDKDLLLGDTEITLLPDDIILNGGLYIRGKELTMLLNGCYM